jgi:spermidine/putrescine transport system permease protein
MEQGNFSRSNDLRIGNGFWLKLLTILGLIFLLLPLPVLVFYSFNENREVTHWTGFSIEWYKAALTNRTLWMSIRNSVFIAFCSATLSTMLGTLAALVLAKYRFRGRDLFQNLLYVPVVLPEIVFGLSLMILFILIRLPLGFVSVICAHVTFSLSFVALIVLARLYRFNRHLEEASLDLGANRLQTFVKIIFPIISTSMISAGLFAFTLSMDDFVITLFTSGAHSATLPLFIYSTVKYGVTPELNAISTLLILITLAGLGAVGFLQKHPVASKSVKRVMATALGLVVVLLIAAAILAREKQVLNLYNYSGYMSQDVIDEFEKETGIQVNWNYYNSNEELLARLTMGVSDYDLVVPSDYMVQTLIKLGLVASIDFNNIPNIRYIDPTFRRMTFDPDGKYYVPYTYGTSGILYNSDVVKEPVDSWAILWDPKYADQITMLDDMRETFFVGLKRVGARLQDRNPDDLEKALVVLTEQKKLLQRYESNNGDALLLSGDALLVHIWSGEALKLQRTDPQFKFAMPREGVTLFVDNLCIPARAHNKKNAERFINFLLEPKQSARNMEAIVYPMPNKEAQKLLNDQVRPLIEEFSNLDPSQLELIGDLGEFNKQLDEAWTRLRSQ